MKISLTGLILVALAVSIAESKSTKQSAIKTVGGNSNGRQCVFPFRYKGNTYTSCTLVNSSVNGYWCATTNNYGRNRKWGYCKGRITRVRDADVKTFAGNGMGKPCVFPFKYNGKTYHTCTSKHNDGPWCSVSSNYIKNRTWGYCLSNQFDKDTKKVETSDTKKKDAAKKGAEDKRRADAKKKADAKKRAEAKKRAAAAKKRAAEAKKKADTKKRAEAKKRAAAAKKRAAEAKKKAAAAKRRAEAKRRKIMGTFNNARTKTDCPGSDILKHFKRSSTSKCADKCNKLKGCVAFVTDNSGRKCWLKRSCSITIRRNNRKVYNQKAAMKRHRAAFHESQVVAGVFWTRGTGKKSYPYSYKQAAAACKKQGAKLASYKQLYFAWKAGMNVCACGWNSDRKARYPIVTSLVNGCGGKKPGIRTCRWRRTWDAYCFKEPKSVAGVFKVGNGYTMNYKKAVKACQKKGAKLASYKQLQFAYKAGMNVCSCGWTTSKRAYYPITYGTGKGCGGSKPGIRRCNWKKTWNAYCFKAPKTVTGVFRTGHRYKMSYHNAVAACKKLGAVLASSNQLTVAYKNGMNNCSCGWTTDKKARYPITYGTSKGCGGSRPGIRRCNWRKHWNAYCYKKNKDHKTGLNL